MLSAASGSAGLMLGPPGAARTGAQTPTGTAANAGFYHFRVGDIRATVLSDGVIGGPPRIYASDAPEADLQTVLRRAFLPTDHLTLNLNTLLIETGGRPSCSKRAQAGRWVPMAAASSPISPASA
jgi:hypothetical protein